MIGAPGFDPGRLQQSAAPVYKTEPHASANVLGRSGWIRTSDLFVPNEKPADLPVQLPTKFDMALNLKTAKALGPAVPASIMLRVDEVIE